MRGHPDPCISGRQGCSEGQEGARRRHRERSIDRLGGAKAFRALGAEFAVTYLNDHARKHVEPLAQALEAPIFMPLDVMVEDQTEAVFERIEKEWGQLDFLLHSIAFSPKEALHGRVVDVGRDGFLKTMEVSCWSFMRMAHWPNR
jgi:enoyl-[acyl-carrier protein] reductase I